MLLLTPLLVNLLYFTLIETVLLGFVICLTKHYLIDPYILKSKYQFIKLILRFGPSCLRTRSIPRLQLSQYHFSVICFAFLFCYLLKLIILMHYLSIITDSFLVFQPVLDTFSSKDHF